MDTVLLAEKPSQAQKYSAALTKKPQKKNGYIEVNDSPHFPNGIAITWAVGHLFRLKNPYEYNQKYKRFSMDNLPIFPEHEYVLDSTKKDRFAVIKSLVSSVNTVIIGCDPDREGEAIARKILQFTDIENKTLKRLWINSLEKDEILNGIQNLRDAASTYNFYIEAQTREKADWLVGMNLSPLFTLSMQSLGYKDTLSIGRVQSPATYLIYQREKEIENFVKENFYEIYGVFYHENGNYKGKANIKTKDKNEALNTLKSYNISPDDNGTITSLETKQKEKRAPKLHSLSSLQTRANKRWKYSPKQTLNIVQELYDKNILSYPRTDTNYITEHEYQYLADNVEKYKSLINADFESKFDNKTYVNSNKVQEHYAIIPTRQVPNSLNDLSKQQYNIYNEVLRTTLSMFHDPYLYDETIIKTDVKGLEFTSKGTTDTQLGWKSLFQSSSKQQEDNDGQDDDNQNKKQEPLPIVEQNDEVGAKVRIKEGETKPPKPYTLGQIVNAMMTCGKLVDDPEDAEVLKETKGIGTEATRGDIIENIQNKGYVTVQNNKLYMLNKGKVMCEAIDDTLLSSPEMTAKWETYLKKIGEGNGSQETFLKQIHEFIEKMIENIPQKVQSSQSIQPLINQAESDKYIADCPKCDDGKIVDKNKIYGCTNYKSGCDMSIPKTLAKKSITPNMVKTLAEKGRTQKLKGFKNKQGKKFDTVLKFNDSYQIKFEFDKSKKTPS